VPSVFVIIHGRKKLAAAGNDSGGGNDNQGGGDHHGASDDHGRRENEHG
jgi:hypothetical protein